MTIVGCDEARVMFLTEDESNFIFSNSNLRTGEIEESAAHLLLTTARCEPGSAWQIMTGPIEFEDEVLLFSFLGPVYFAQTISDVAMKVILISAEDEEETDEAEPDMDNPDSDDFAFDSPSVYGFFANDNDEASYIRNIDPDVREFDCGDKKAMLFMRPHMYGSLKGFEGLTPIGRQTAMEFFHDC